MTRHAPQTFEERLAQLDQRRQAAVHSGSESAVEKQHARGKLTARERIDRLLDPGSFEAVSYTHLTLPTTPYV